MTYDKDVDQCPSVHPNSLGAGRCDRPAGHKGRHGANLTAAYRPTWGENMETANYAVDPMDATRWCWCCDKDDACPDHTLVTV